MHIIKKYPIRLAHTHRYETRTDRANIVLALLLLLSQSASSVPFHIPGSFISGALCEQKHMDRRTLRRSLISVLSYSIHRAVSHIVLTLSQNLLCFCCSRVDTSVAAPKSGIRARQTHVKNTVYLPVCPDPRTLG